MNKVILQLWEELDQNQDLLSNGCSIHLNADEGKTYIMEKQSFINEDRTVGGFIDVFVSDELYQALLIEKSVKISESSFRNLIKFENIIYNRESV